MSKLWIFVFLVCIAALITFISFSGIISEHQFIYSKIWKNDTPCVTPLDFSTHKQIVDNRRLDLPDTAAMKMMNGTQLMETYFRYINNLQVLCRNQTRLGSMRDGGKEICEDDLYKPTYPCLVYSFGSGFKFDFELDVIRIYNCEVNTFDPSHPIGNRSIPRGIHFHLIGLWNKPMTNKKGWRMETLSSIRKLLNHTNRTIDVLKMDIEGGEWLAIPEMIQSGVLNYVKQICIEVHFNGKPQQLTVLRQLFEYGFYIFMRDRNLVRITNLKTGYRYRYITKLNEISLINIHLKHTEHPKQ